MLWILKLISFGVLAIVMSVAMFRSGDTKETLIIGIVVFLMFFLAVKILRELKYCLLDEKGITFFFNFKKHSFVSWESIKKVELRQYGHGRWREDRVIIYNDEYSKELISNSDDFEDGVARSFCKTMGSDSVFSEYLKYYRPDLKIEEI